MRGRKHREKCSVEGCNRPYAARGWCGKHYLRWYKGKTLIPGPPGAPPGDDLSQRLAPVRKSLGLTQRELAEMLGVNPHYVYQLEKGYKRASKKLQLRLVEVVASLRAQRRLERQRLRRAGLA